MRFLCSAKYRRKVLIVKPFKGFCKRVQSKRNTDAKMQVDFPSRDQIGKLKNIVDAVEIKLRGGNILSDYGAVVKGTKDAAESGLKAWDATKTVSISTNAAAEIMLGGHALENLPPSGRKVTTFAVYAAELLAHVFGSVRLPDLYLVGLVFGRGQLKLAHLRKV